MSLKTLNLGLVAALLIAIAFVVSEQRKISDLRSMLSTLQSQSQLKAQEKIRLEAFASQAAAQIASLRAEIDNLKTKVSSVAPLVPPVEQRKSLRPDASAAEMIAGRVSRLSALVHLTPEQEARLAEIYEREAKALEAFAPGDERTIKGMDIRRASRSEVRGLLTPEQRQKHDVTPQRLGGGLSADPANLTARFDQAVGLTAVQKEKVSNIFWNDLIDQMAGVPADQALPGFRWSDKVRDQLRSVLTPEQKAKFDATPPYGKK